MALLDERTEQDDLGGGRFRSVLNIAPVAYRDTGVLKRIASNWLDSGIVGRPHIVSAANFIVSMGNEGLRRVHPKRDLSRYIEIGPPLVKPALTWQSVGFSNPTRIGNVTKWSRTQADLEITHGGHFIKLEMPLKGGYVPPNSQVACHVELVGLTRQGDQLYADGVPVMWLRKPMVYDRANPTDVRPIAYEFVKVAGNNYILFTLPSLAGMAQPVIDPTFTDGYGGDVQTYKDTWLNSSNPTGNAGVTTILRVGRFSTPQIGRDLLQFDVSSLSGSTCDSATLNATVDTNFGGGAFNILLYRVRRAWVEGDGTAGSGATWNTYDGTNSWTTAGCADTTNDREAGSIGTCAITTGSSGELSWPLTASAVQDWWDGDFTNNGLLMQSDDETGDKLIDFASSDHATTANRPKLVVVYTTAGGGTPARRYMSLLGVGR